MLESRIEALAVHRCLNELGVRSLKLNVTGDRGWPDRLFFIPGGVPLFIEFKQPGQVPEARQRLIHAFLEYNGYGIETHDSVASAVKAVQARVEAAARCGWAPDVEKAKRRLVAAQLSEKGRKIPPR
jgi:hypothetical protein